jgi:broad specificity phosphatase PhoE
VGRTDAVGAAHSGECRERGASVFVMRRLILVKHGQPVLDGSRPAREWLLGPTGEAQAVRLADELRCFLPFRLVSSMEPKALATCRIVANALCLPMYAAPALAELDRRTLPIMPTEEHALLNARIFAEPSVRVLGDESAAEALSRFSAAVAAEADVAGDDDVVIIAHGTVISLLVAQHNALDAYVFWRRLQCGSFVVLQLPSLALLAGPKDAPLS